MGSSWSGTHWEDREVTLYDLLRKIAERLSFQTQEEQAATLRLVKRLDDLNAFGTVARDIKETYRVQC